jgi:hypothetical protein
MTETQEVRGRRIEGRRLVPESFHKGQDLSPFSHPYEAGITNSRSKEGRVGLTAGHFHFISTRQSNGSMRARREARGAIESSPASFSHRSRVPVPRTANRDARYGTGPVGRTRTRLRTIDKTAFWSPTGGQLDGLCGSSQAGFDAGGKVARRGMETKGHRAN